MNKPPQNAPQKPAGEMSWLELVDTQVSSLRFGSVQIIVHDSQVVEVDKTERVRLDKGGSTLFS